jgi:hypothetical protein
VRRIYDRDARKVLAQFFENCADAVRAKQIADPHKLGEVAKLVRKFVGFIEDLSGGSDSDALETFEFAELNGEFPMELAEVLWKNTGVALSKPDVETEVDFQAIIDFQDIAEKYKGKTPTELGRLAGILLDVAYRDSAGKEADSIHLDFLEAIEGGPKPSSRVSG